MRACVEALAAADPGWAVARLDIGRQHRYGSRIDTYQRFSRILGVDSGGNLSC